MIFLSLGRQKTDGNVSWSKGREVEFLIETDEGIVPIEVKAGNSPTISFDALLKNSSVPYGYKFVDGNIGVVDKKITLPHYLAMFLKPGW